MPTAFLYHRVYDALKARIASGELAPGAKLPGEKELTSAFSVSVITVKKAMNLLVEEGLVARIPGRGTFVREGGEATFARAELPLVGVIFEHVTSAFGLTMLYEMDRLLLAAGWRMVHRFSYCDRAHESDEIRFLLDLGAAGLIIMPSHGPNYNPDVLKLVLQGFPVILVDKKLDGIDVPSVRTDNRAAMRFLALYLAKSGKKHIGLLTTAIGNASSTAERRQGFRDALREAGLPEAPECVLPSVSAPESDESYQGTVARLAQYLSLHQSALDAIVCSEYDIVPKLLRAARMIGLDLTGRIEVCCVDEDSEAPMGCTFAHMKQDEKAIARRAVELLLQRLGPGPNEPATDELIPAIFFEKRG